MNYYYNGAYTQCLRDICQFSLYSAAYSFWSLEELQELKKGVTGRGEGARGVCVGLELQCDKVNRTHVG